MCAQKAVYWGIDTTIGDYQLGDALPTRAATTRPLAAIRTRLNPFDAVEQGQLINWRYALADAELRRYGPAPHWLPPAWPDPAYSLDR